ncbi:MAG: aminotransferase class I/II-fold pyridoxal phosphate-dependent enzyme [Methanobacteriota archaeon]|nr:MAG: aminotransferase class I/II-fold pyridoxal phosphate-dependent enzyme [Euryarchaeota archaeon]
MVRMQCAHEGSVDYDLSGSGVPPPRLDEIIDTQDLLRELLSERQGYAPAGGSPALRSSIASIYSGAGPENIMVTNGATEANFVGAWRLLEKGDEIVVIVPNYLQTWNLATSWGVRVKPLQLREEAGWQFDLEEIKSVVTSNTKAVQLCNPNNPTGAALSDEHRKALLDAARETDAWVLCDEVYIGAEVDGVRTRSLWGTYERMLVTNGLCKAYGLPGLRVGWLVGEQETLKELTAYRDYLTLTHSTPSDYVARVVLERERREKILSQNQAFIREGFRNLLDWGRNRDPPFSWVSPRAGPMCFASYHSGEGSLDIATRLLKEKSVLVVPGVQLGMDGYLRIATGVPREYLHEGLSRLSDIIADG